MPRIDRSIENSALFKFFMQEQKPGSPESVHLPDQQRNHLSGEGAPMLHDFARTREYDGRRSRPGQERVEPREQEVARYILEVYPHLLSLEGRVRLADLFGVDLGDAPAGEGKAPRKDAPIALDPSIRSQLGRNLTRIDLEHLPDLFVKEYRQRRGELEGRGTPEERSARVLSLFKEYASALWSQGERPETERIGQSLLDAFETTRFGAVLGKRSANGAPWNAAQGMVLGLLDPNTFPTEFPKAGKDVATTYLAMNDGNARAMKVVDAFSKMSGRGASAKAEEFERKSVLNWVVGLESGNNKFGNFDERRPFSSSGINWGVALFPGDAEVASLPPKPGFEFPIDALNAFGYLVRAEPERGNRLEVRDAEGRSLRVEKNIHRDADGAPVHWSARFFRGDEEVPPSDVLGVITQGGRVKGDGRADQSMSMGWWGKCDRNAAMGVVKDFHDIPELNVDDIPIPVAGEVISMPRALGQRLIDTDLLDMTQWSFMGFRFNDEPQQVQLKGGQTVEGRIASRVIESAGNIKPLDGDLVAVHGTKESPLLGTVKIDVGGRTEEIEARDILRVERQTGEQALSFVVKAWSGERTVKGTPATPIDFSKAEKTESGEKIEQAPGFPIRGEIELMRGDGTTERIAAALVDQIVGETESDVRPSQFMSWIARHDGVYVLDTSLREMVANGRKWTSRFEMEDHVGERPDWAPSGELVGRYGPLERQPGDRIAWVRGHSDSKFGSSVHMAGWIQRSKTGRIVNEGFVRGAPDFGWAPSGPLNWDAKSSNNPYFPPEFRKALFANGVKLPDDEKEQLMQRLNFPDWRTYLADPSKAPTPIA